jgi:CheY-like chemotaxis protein
MLTELRHQLVCAARDLKPSDGPVIIVDDNDDDQFMLRREVRFIFGDVPLKTFRNGQFLLEYLREESAREGASWHIPRLILLDLNMPRMNGWQALRALRALPACRDIPVIVVSTTGDSEEIAEAYEGGASLCLTKPTARDAPVVMV